MRHVSDWTLPDGSLLLNFSDEVRGVFERNAQVGGKRPVTPSPPGSPNSVFVSTPNDVDTNTLQFLLNSASA